MRNCYSKIFRRENLVEGSNYKQYFKVYMKHEDIKRGVLATYTKHIEINREINPELGYA